MKNHFYLVMPYPNGLPMPAPANAPAAFAVMLYFLSVNWNFFLRLHRARQK